MRNYFTFAGRPSTDFGLYINGQGTFGAPAHSFEITPIPGKNGDLIFDNKRFENFDLKYPAFIMEDFKTNLAAFRSFVLSKRSYQRLEDTYHPDEFRLAFFKEAIEPDVWFDNSFGSLDVTFNCKPQRFLKSGETKLEFTESPFSIENPTLFPAKPMVRVHATTDGSGVLTIGGVVITIEDIPSFIDLDFETMNAYFGATSWNRYIQISTLDYPDLEPGVNNFAFSGDITKVEVTPRWYII